MIHAAVTCVAWFGSNNSPTARTPEPTQPTRRRETPLAQPPIPQPSLRLGADSDKPSTAMSWIGYAAPTEQAAPQGPVDQPALGLAGPTAPAPQTTPQTAPPNSPQEPTSEPTPEPRPHAAAAATPEPAPAPDPVPAKDVTPTPPTTAGLTWRETLQDALDAIARARAAAPPPPQQRPAPSAPQASRPAPPSTAGALSDRESIAAAIRGAAVVRPGQVLSAGGLDVRTVQPRWGRVTLRTAKPRNPTVAVTFAKNGKVKLADFAKDGDLVFDAGSPDLNEPLLNAVYAWTATGKALETLPTDDSAGITVLFRIILTP